MMSVLFGKAWRVNTIFNNPSLTKKVAITNTRLIKRCLAVVSVMAALVIVWMIVDPPRLVLQVASTSGESTTSLRGVLARFQGTKMLFEPKDEIEIFAACSER